MGLLQQHLGIGGWEHEVLDRCFYPRPDLSTTEKLTYYSRFLNAVEARATFWDENLTGSHARGWAEAVSPNKNFLFLVKLHSTFTHKQDIRPKATHNIRNILQELARHNRLGGLLMQFPYSFTNTSNNRFHLARLAKLFRGFPVFVELRHASWDQAGPPSQSAAKFGRAGLTGFLHDHNLSPIHADLPRMQQYMPFFTKTAGDTAYLRLHGRNEKGWLTNDLDARYDYLYNSRELVELKRRVENVSRTRTRIFVMFNNTTAGKAIPNVFHHAAQLRGGKRMILPAASIRVFPHLREIGTADSEDNSLFSSAQYRRAM